MKTAIINSMIKKTLLSILSLLTILPAVAFAGTIDLPQTGQTTFYNAAGGVISCAGTGRDGDLQYIDCKIKDLSDGRPDFF